MTFSIPLLPMPFDWHGKGTTTPCRARPIAHYWDRSVVGGGLPLENVWRSLLGDFQRCNGAVSSLKAFPLSPKDEDFHLRSTLRYPIHGIRLTSLNEQLINGADVTEHRPSIVIWTEARFLMPKTEVCQSPVDHSPSAKCFGNIDPATRPRGECSNRDHLVISVGTH